MKKYVRQIFAVAIFLSLSAPSSAGSPGGLHIIALPTSKAVAYEARVKAFFKQYDESSEQGVCDDVQLAVGSVFFNSGKTGITGDAAKQAISSTKQRKKLSRMLTGYRDKSYPRGFDAALVYDVAGGKLVFHGISGFAPKKAYSASVALKDIDDASKLALAVCKAAAHLPVLEWND